MQECFIGPTTWDRFLNLYYFHNIKYRDKTRVQGLKNSADPGLIPKVFPGEIPEQNQELALSSVSTTGCAPSPQKAPEQNKMQEGKCSETKVFAFFCVSCFCIFLIVTSVFVEIKICDCYFPVSLSFPIFSHLQPFCMIWGFASFILIV